LSKSKYKTLLGTLFSVVFLVAYIVVYSRINTYIEVLINNGENIARSLSGVLPLYWLGAAVSDGNLLYLLFVLLIICAIFALVYFLLSATFVRATLNKRSDSRVKYKRQTLKSSSASTALLKKEFKRLTSSTAYIMNAGVGIIMELIGCVFLVIKRDEITDVLGMDGEFGSIIVPIIIVTMCFFQSMSLFSAPSISLEGKNIYFLKSLPVEPKKILMAKVNMHFLVTSPVSIIVSLVFMFILKPGALMSVFLIVLPLLINGLTAFGGVAVNLRFPKLEWTNEVQVIKQGTSIIICMFGGMFVVLIPVLLYGFLLVKYLSVELALAIFAALLILGIAALYVHLSKKGTKRFLEL
jgi:ABC-2 type transport system permease protein